MAVLLALLTLSLFTSCASDGEQQALEFSPGSLPAARLYGSALSARLISSQAAGFRRQLQDMQRLGRIEIPRIGVREWIVQGTSDEALRLGAGHLEETAVPGMGGNFTLSGDRVLYTSPFLRLDGLQVGDTIGVQMPYGDFQYVIESITVNSPTDVHVILPKGYETITLSTCDPPWGLSSRLTVSARLQVSEPSA